MVARFYRVGGTTRVAGFMLAAATALLLIIGTGPISYIRECMSTAVGTATYHVFQAVMLVGALIFVLGIDLVKEALWDTRNRVDRLEYLTIVSIMIAMTVWDFVFGVLFGIVASCESTWEPDGAPTLSDLPQASSSWSRIPSRIASARFILAGLLCQLFGDLALTGRTYGRYQNRPPSFASKDFSSLVRSRMSKNQCGV